MLDEQATRAAIQAGFDDLRAKVTRADTVILYFAANRIAESRDTFLVTNDSDLQDIRDTGFAMTALDDALQRLSAARIVVFMDVSHGNLGLSPSKSSLQARMPLAGGGPTIFGLTASQSNQSSIEGLAFGGGHGVFTYFLVRGLNGDADTNHDGFVAAGELASYVIQQVTQATARKQIPREFGDSDTAAILFDLHLPGVQLTR